MNRYFLAFYPSTSVRNQIEAFVSRLEEDGARLILPENYHMTVAYIGEEGEKIVPSVRSVLEGLNLKQSFSITLNKLGYFAEASALWFGTSKPAPILLQTVNEIRMALSDAGITYDSGEFIPHITLMRGDGIKPEQGYFCEVSWTVNDLVLLVSSPGSKVYEHLYTQSI